MSAPRKLAKAPRGAVIVYVDASLKDGRCAIARVGAGLDATDIVDARSNNEGEVFALLFAMDGARDLQRVVFRTDSECAAHAANRPDVRRHKWLLGRLRREVGRRMAANPGWIVEQIERSQNLAHAAAKGAL